MAERKTRPGVNGTGQEPSTSTASSSLAGYSEEDVLAFRNFEDPTPFDGICVVCGEPAEHLSTLGRCLPCIKAASAAWSARIAAHRPLSPPFVYDPTDPRAMWIQGAWTKHPPLPLRNKVWPTSTGDARKRLEGVLRHLAATEEGSRNATLYWAGCRVREMLLAGQVRDPFAASETLAIIGLNIGLGEREVRATIRSALRSEATP